MVAPAHSDHPKPAWRLASKMTVYAASFLAFVLGLLPYGFHYLGLLIYPAGAQNLLSPSGENQQFIGAAIFVLGLAGYLFCSLWLVIVGKGPFVEFDPPTAFVASGPYRWTRNPVAALLIITILGEAIYFGSAGILTLVLLGIPLAQLQVTRIEEPRLRQRFGVTYEEYCLSVPRWLPKRPKS